MPTDSEGNTLHKEIEQKVPRELQQLLNARDGAAILCQKLPQFFKPEQIVRQSTEQRAWELIGLYYFNQDIPRNFEALSIFLALYQYMLEGQEKLGERIHKGMPLLWVGECYALSNYTALRKRYLMLALCEDAIREGGTVSAGDTGVYFRLVWRLGMADAVLRKYAEECNRLATENPDQGKFPEWILQNIDQDWVTELPSPVEANVYVANTFYMKRLLSKLGSSKGVALEHLAEYIMLCMPGCRTSRRKRSLSTDYDIVCSMEGFDVDFRSELGRYFVCECKDWNKPADFAAMAKFCRVLDSVKSKFGVLFSSNGISGVGDSRYAAREQLKVFQDRGMIIVVVDENHLRSVANGANFINILRKKYERVRLDLAEGDIPTTA